MTICRRCCVSGKVQGVFFRASTRDKARSLGIVGHAKNLPDGRVEVIACGEEQEINELIAWLREGPRMARVESLQIEDIDVDVPEGFRIL